jgi:hypothetical protein
LRGRRRARWLRQIGEVERRQAADEDDQQQSQQDYGVVAHQASGLAIPPLPVRLNARDGLDVAARFRGAPITKIRMPPRAFMVNQLFTRVRRVGDAGACARLLGVKYA